MKFEGNYWCFTTYDMMHHKILLAPGMITLQLEEFTQTVGGLRANYMDNALFGTKNEAIDYLIARLEEMRNG